METIAKWIIIIASAAAVIILLPASFIQTTLASLDVPYLAQVNWLIPIGQMYAISLVWLSAIGTYYLISWLCRELGILD